MPLAWTLLCLSVPFRIFGGFCVGNVLELLHPPRVLFRSKHPILLIDGHANQGLELARHLPVSETDKGQQPAFPVEDLQPVVHLVSHPNVAIAIHRNAFRPRKKSWSVSILAKRRNEITIGIEDLHPVVQCVRHEDITLLIDSNPFRRTEIARGSQRMVLSAGSNPPLQLQGVGVVDQNLILLCVHNVEKAVGGIESDPDRIRPALP